MIYLLSAFTSRTSATAIDEYKLASLASDYRAVNKGPTSRIRCPGGGL